MSLKCGIIGLPNVGKSTLFNILTASNCPAENFPFCTIEPNHAIVPVADERLEHLAGIAKPKKIIPATVEFVDIAGLVKGAASGEGLGNRFLSHIRQVDALVHVIRCFQDDQIVHVSGKVDPFDDIETIHLELILADTESVEQYLQRHQFKTSKAPSIPIGLLEKILSGLKKGFFVRQLLSSAQDISDMKGLPLLTAKPILYVANVGKAPLSAEFQSRLDAKISQSGSNWMRLCVQQEQEIRLMESEDRKRFSEKTLEVGGALDRLTQLAYRLLEQQSFFTVGEKELRAWTIPRGATAAQAAGVIHTDFEKGFIRAEVTAYDMFVRHFGAAGAKAAGKMRLEGKKYLVQDGDVMHFRFNV